MTPRQLLDFLALAAIWGASFLFMRVAVPYFGPVPLMLVRCAIGAMTLVCVLAWLGKTAELRSNVLKLGVVGVLNSAIPFVLLGYSALSLTAGVTSILNSLAPLWSAIIALAWLGDRLTRFQILGLVLGAVGVMILVSGATVAPAAAELDQHAVVDLLPRVAAEATVHRTETLVTATTAGAVAEDSWLRVLPFLAGILATAFYGFAANFARRFLAGVDPIVTATGSQLSASLFLLLPGLLFWPADSPEPLASGPSLSLWLSAIALGVVCTGFAYLLFFRLIAGIGATRTIAVTYVIPVFGVGWGWLFLGERIGAVTLAGAAVIVLGTALTTGVADRWLTARQTVDG